ncbi:DUF2141 domain-containing protein [Pseudoduganella plicata]|uniref:DUF2141 domain-containing protein n=1 Tax=Pseudoduganella plicata TaxID=321984 RepID=A0A4P7BJI7_9BURK|nr:DUF2141 domain-containing protein [Pseudoduganella plicata]QBQ37825.1 DUF2141 domain-containing protein [Pseudoduganella plicata]GGY93376.1 hypothetical protein GCM10007388_28610 [Pseudoduganella plicata]
MPLPLRPVVIPLLLALGAQAAAATVEVRVSAVGPKGKVNVAVCDRERFLKECAYSASVAAQPGTTTVTVSNVPPGTWVVLAYQDENDNGKLDRNLIGIPSENYGFSRDAAGRFGPPKFDDAAIEVSGQTTIAAIKLH